MLPQLIAANPHFHKHLKDLRKNSHSARSSQQSEENFCLTNAMLADWPHALHMRNRQSGPALHTYTHRHARTDTLLAYSPGFVCSEHMNPWIFPFFNLAHRWRVLTAPQPSHARDTRSWLWKIVTQTQKKKKERKKSVALNGKDDSGESVFFL